MEMPAFPLGSLLAQESPTVLRLLFAKHPQHLAPGSNYATHNSEKGHKKYAIRENTQF